MTITVKDSFFREDLAKLIQRCTETFQWQYNHKSDISNPDHNKFFVSHLWATESEDNFFSALWRMTQKQLNEVENFCCWRIIANGQVKGQGGNWHTDHGDKTILYFPLDWIPEWGGSTYFSINKSETEVKYRRNRLIVFDANTPHYGSCPKIDNVLRVSIAFNLRKTSSQDARK